MTCKSSISGVTLTLVDEQGMGLDSNANYKSVIDKDLKKQPNCVSEAQWNAFTIEEEFCKPQVVNKNKVESPDKEITCSTVALIDGEGTSSERDENFDLVTNLDQAVVSALMTYEKDIIGAIDEPSFQKLEKDCRELIGLVVAKDQFEVDDVAVTKDCVDDAHVKKDAANANIWKTLNKVMRL